MLLADCDIRVMSKSVSRLHAELHLLAGPAGQPKLNVKDCSKVVISRHASLYYITFSLDPYQFYCGASTDLFFGPSLEHSSMAQELRLLN